MATWSMLGVLLAGGIITAVGATSGCGSPSRASRFGDGDGGSSSGAGGSSSGTAGSSNGAGDDSGPMFSPSDGSTGASSSGAPGDGGPVVCPPGLMCDVPCPGGSTTTISGTVYDPALKNPLYDIAVYVPQSSLPALPKGVVTGPDACSCGALFKSGAVVSTTTGVDGKFTLTNAPVGSNVKLVLQVGKWRHVVTIPTVTACTDNAQTDKSLALNATVAAGSDDNMPDIAVSTGHSDTLECLIKRIGVPDSEFVPGTSTAGHVHLYLGGDPNSPWHGTQTGGQPTRELAPMPNAPESATTLWDTAAHLMPYDILLLSCEGGPTFNANPPVLEQYLNSGGRAFASHYHYEWFMQQAGGTPPVVATPADCGSCTYNLPQASCNLANWTVGSGGGPNPGDGVVDQTLNVGGGAFPKGVALHQWLANVGGLAPLPGVTGVATGDVPIYQNKFNAVVTASNPASQPWITTANGGTNETLYFSFDTPVGGQQADGGAPNYCGRAVFSDLHVDGDPNSASAMDSPNNATTGMNPMPTGTPPPAGCASCDLSPQEKVLEFMLCDLSACVISDKETPPKMIPVVY